jgi:DNA-binding winged helix-turn-helix (wHTH) protein
VEGLDFAVGAGRLSGPLGDTDLTRLQVELLWFLRRTWEASHDGLVSVGTLRTKVWKGVPVGENTIYAAICRARTALRRVGSRWTVLRGERRLGYRLARPLAAAGAGGAVEPDDPTSLAWWRARQRTEESVRDAGATSDGAQAQLYVRRGLEDDVDAFVAGDKATMIIVGQSGMGKTTLIAKVVERYAAEGHVCLVVPSASLPAPTDAIEREILRRLGAEGPPPEAWERLNVAARRAGRRVLVVIDAVNEYNRPSMAPGPADFFAVVHALTRSARSETRLLVTSRPETWKIALDNGKIGLADGDRFHLTADGAPFHLLKYSEAQVTEAYVNYRAHYGIATDFADLTPLARHYLRDPLLLALACEAYKGNAIPPSLDTDEVFDSYLRNVVEDARLAGHELADLLIERVVLAFFRGPDLEGAVLERDSLVLDAGLARAHPDLVRDFEYTYATGRYLERSKDVFRSSAADGRRSLRFRYDRFAEHLMARELRRRIGEAPPDVRRARTLAILEANLPNAQKFNTIFGALQRVLSSAGDDRSDRQASLLRGVTALGEPGVALASSVITRIAMRPGPRGGEGIDVLAALLDQLTSDAPDTPGTTFGPGRKFAVVDAIFRTLQDPEYRLWLSGQPAKAQGRQRDVLHPPFLWALEHEDENVGAAAVQYLFFLWSQPPLRGEARRITNRAVEALNLVRLAAYGALSAISPALEEAAAKEWRLFRNLAMVFLLVLAEGDEATVREALEPAASMLRRLPLRLVGLVGTSLGNWGIDVATQNVNPVTSQALDRLLADRAMVGKAQTVVDLCRAETRLGPSSVPQLVALAALPNALVSTVLSFALSCHYERASDARRSVALRVIADVFRHPEATPQVQYVASLAAYHINVFGRYATDESLAVLAEMARTILATHKGVFRIAPEGKLENFNIVGTYGRALARHDGRRRDRPRRPLAYATDALEAARRVTDAQPEGDAAYYLYLCENVGILGVLVEPQPVLDVLGGVLVDLGVVDSVRGRSLPFPAEAQKQIRRTVLESLATIRVLYRLEVDRFLLDALEAPSLQATVALQIAPQLKLSLFHSWSFEQMMFRLFTSYWDALGATLIDVMREGIEQATARDCCKVVARRMLERVVGLITGPARAPA